MAGELKLDKSKRKTPKPIEETKISKPENSFNLEKFNKEKNKERTQKKSLDSENTTNSTNKKDKTKLVRMVRVSKDTADKVNAIKGTLTLYSQDDVVSKGLDMIINSMDDGDRRLYEILLQVEKKKR
ncbi:hypothetical protein [Limosilactobacillus reuteri]|uniref:hypothetical protein n=1 Tax=Limosilactobacillus reuteri TaxID=1598 RepID=UPI001E4A9874|nr:hypothetical protein [Limosilactobacillus reuteri]MCC4466862.1 hypothetical protein [Limosilactobacillus reuteri]MCC4472892.1 hypothetical protein [Limosilactobacillus reuteri]